MTDISASQPVKRGPGRPPKGSDSNPPDITANFSDQLLLSLSDPRIGQALSKLLLPELMDKVAELERRNKNLETTMGQLEAERIELKDEIDCLKARLPVRETAETYSAAAAAREPSTDSYPKDTLAAVHKEMADKKRRAKNIIVIGLKPEPGQGDEITFTQFMEGNLGVKPALARGKSRRLGATQPGKTQPLLITFNSEETARDVLREGPKLKNLTPRIYLNPDLTPAEALAAYKQREKRRGRQLAENHTPEDQNSRATAIRQDLAPPNLLNHTDFPQLPSAKADSNPQRV